MNFTFSVYESELAPEAYKENARQHPRANPVISEKHVLHNNIRLGMQQDREKSRASINPNLKSMTQLDSTIATTRTSSPNKASETLADKLIPVYAGGSLAANSVSSKIQSAVSKHPLTANTMPSQNASASSSRLLNSPSLSASQSRKNTTQNGASMDNYLMNKSEYEEDAKTMSPKQDLSSSSASLGGKYAQKGVSLRNNSMNRYEQGNETRTMTPLQKSSSFSAASMSGKNTSQKGASTKDYSLSRFERMDNERTASQLQGPSRSSSNAGMMDKVRGAVNSLLGNEEPSQTQQGKTPSLHYLCTILLHIISVMSLYILQVMRMKTVGEFYRQIKILQGCPSSYNFVYHYMFSFLPFLVCIYNNN